MGAKFQSSQVINRPVDKVFQFVVRDHVKNHPRWDPDIKLWLDTDEPLGLGTIIHRRNSRSGTPVDGTMEVTEFEPNHAFSTITRDGLVEIVGRMTFEAISEAQTRLTIDFEIPGMDESMDKTNINRGLERTGEKRKEMIESET